MNIWCLKDMSICFPNSPGACAAQRSSIDLLRIFPADASCPLNKMATVTFGTLSRAVRINDGLVKVWAELLKRIPTARLVINSGDFKTEEMQQWMQAKFKAYGVDAERLSVGFDTPAWIPMQQIDIMLDCFPHNSGTTLFESLYSGIPFVSLAHRPTVGRVGAQCSGFRGKAGMVG